MLAPSQVIGRYALYNEIASGGMATVCFGRLLGPVGFSRTVAIKRLHAQFAKDPEFVAMFLDEARLAARIRHPNVVPTLDVVATEGELFLVMEYVQGETLARLVRGSQVPPRIVASILCGVLHGLHAAHEAVDEHGAPLNIVHRDISPQNVMVGVDGVARILDFGIAKAQGRAYVTREGHMKGKIPYMAPEQVLGDVCRQADVYAAAVVTWEALVGRRLFRGENDVATLHAVMNGAVLPPSKAVEGVTDLADAVVLRGLERDPSRRWPTAKEMARALESAVGVASPSEVGDWVSARAIERLSQRSITLNAIESSSFRLVEPGKLVEVALSRPQDPPSPSSAPSSAPPSITTNTAVTAPSSVAPASGDASAAHARADGPSKGLGRVVLVVAAIATAATGGVFVGLRSTPDSSREKASAAAAAPSTRPDPVAPPTFAPAASAVPSNSPGAEADSAPSPSASSPSVSGSTTPPRPAGPPVRPGPRPAQGVKAAPASCSPPYTLDAAGHRHYKPECL